MSSRLRHPLTAVVATVLLTLPWLGTYATESVEAVGTLGTVAISGVAVLGASFLLAWGAETAEKDVPRAFAIAILAVLAVAPEYAVDALYAWTAGANVGTERGAEAANLAVANMTGANRILIGLGWSGIALFTVYRTLSSEDPAVVRKPGFLNSVVQLDRTLATEITFLLAATGYAFLVPLGAGIGILDTLVLVGIYAVYIGIIIRGDVEDHDEQVGVPAYLQTLPKRPRIASVLLLFGYSGAMIYTAVHPFAHGLEEIGLSLGIPPFFMIQWIAPLASESPELIVVAYLVNKARSTAGFNALISSKLNQWTLLITAAQSLFAIAILVNFEISVREALMLLVLFVSQVVLEFLLIRDAIVLPLSSYDLLLVYTGIYVALGLVLFVRRREALAGIIRRTNRTISEAFSTGRDQPRSGDD